MYIAHIDSIKQTDLSGDDYKHVAKKIVLGPEQGWEGHVMRVFTLSKGGYTPQHTHPWPHITYMIRGSGVVFHEGEETPIKAGSVVFVPPGTEHRFRNTGDEDFVFMCIVPEEGEK
jgi:quercetin dioxygenase-like cupin family protein